MDDDELDGCELDFSENPTPDDEVDYVVLFAGVPEDEIEKVAAEYKELFNAV